MEKIDKVKELIRDQLGVSLEQVLDDINIYDLGADCRDMIELVMALENEFNIEIPDEDMEKLHTVSEMVRYVEEKVSRKAV